MNGQALSASIEQIGPFGGQEALDLYDGTEIFTVSSLSGAADRETSFVQMCERTWADVHGEPITEGRTTYASVCSQLRMIVRGLWDAGPDLTTEAAVEAWQALGEVELNNGRIGTLGPGKTDAPDEYQVAVFDADCECLELADDWRPVGG